MRYFYLDYSPSDFEKIARIVSENLIYQRGKVEELKKSDWRKMLNGKPSHPYERELVDILNNTRGTKPYTLQRISGLVDFFMREEEIHLHFSHEYIDCKFYIFKMEGAATISWEDEHLQQNPRLVKKVLMPILDALKQAGFGHFGHFDKDVLPEAELSKEAIAFLQKPSNTYF